MTKPIFEYILSGTSYLGCHDAKTSAAITPFLEKCVASLREKSQHKFGVLFNALMEEKNGDLIKQNECIRFLDSIHADSGGLQMVTLGKASGPEEKKIIYGRQASMSTVGMCFDEIPVISKGSSTTDYASRFYDPSIIESCARKTGDNLREQIEYFLDVGSKCKPMLIAQGNCYDTYNRWVDIALSRVPKDMQLHIGGLAMGAAALGAGELEEMEKAFILSRLQLETDNYHLLGVGSMSRLLPTLMLARGGVFDGKHISYDSTTHSSSVEGGRYYLLGEDGIINHNYEKTMSPRHIKMSNDIIGNLGSIIEPSLIHEVFTNGAPHFRNSNRIDDFFKGKIASCMSSVINFANCVDLTVDTNQPVHRFVGNKMYLESFSEIKTLDDYRHWYSTFGRYLKSARVSRLETNNIDSFFE